MAEPLNATFYAFQKRERSGVLMQASIAFFIVAIVLMGAFAALFWLPLVSLISWYGELLGMLASGDPNAGANLAFPMGMFAVIPGILLWTLFFYVLFAAYEAACLKWLIHGETGGFMGLTLGPETWRVYSGYWVWYGLYLASSVALSIVLVAVMSVLAIGGAASGVSSSDALAIGGTFGAAMVLLYLAYYGALIYFGVRMAPAAATSIARRKFSFFQAWRVTKGRFWSLLGSFAILFFIYSVIIGVFLVVSFGAIFSAAAVSAPNLFSTDPTTASQAVVGLVQALITALQQPATWAIFATFQAAGLAIAMVLYVAMFGVNARAVRAAMDDGALTQPAAA